MSPTSIIELRLASLVDFVPIDGGTFSPLDGSLTKILAVHINPQLNPK